MKVKVGDQVKILAGKDRNKEGKIIAKTKFCNNLKRKNISFSYVLWI